jgi:hypothetical protein
MDEALIKVWTVGLDRASLAFKIGALIEGMKWKELVSLAHSEGLWELERVARMRLEVDQLLEAQLKAFDL